MIETLVIMLFCSGYLLCCVAYGILASSGDDCSAYRRRLENGLNYLSASETEQKIDMYLTTLIYAIFMFCIGFLFAFTSVLLEPKLFYCSGGFLAGFYLIVLVYTSIKQIIRSKAIIERKPDES